MELELLSAISYHRSLSFYIMTAFGCQAGFNLLKVHPNTVNMPATDQKTVCGAIHAGTINSPWLLGTTSSKYDELDGSTHLTSQQMEDA